VHDASDAYADAFSREFGRNMRDARIRKSWSQRELAEALTARGVKLDPSAVTRIERGAREAKLREAVAIAACLDIDVQKLLNPTAHDPIAMALELRRLAEIRIRSGRSAFRELGQHVQGLARILYASQAAQAELARLRGWPEGLEPHELVVGELKDLLRELREPARDSELEVDDGFDIVLQKVVNEAVENLFTSKSSQRAAGRKRRSAGNDDAKA
jgi:transcriptional regulator with XRE-family HTH domain